MNKQEFLQALGKGLSGLPYAEQDKWMDFYGEMIEDRIEEGLSEEEAVAAVGSVEDVIAQILAQSKPEKKEKKKRELKSWHWVLLIAGSPIWFSLLIAAASVIFSLIVALWSVVIVFYAIAVSLLVSGAACVVMPLILVPMSIAGAGTFNLTTGLVAMGAGLFAVGLGIYWFIGTHYMTKGVVQLCKKLFAMLFPGKEAAQ